ncbi:hypothetical protein SBI_00004 [Streptomyces bingchenggensis BCW-1]|uniref:Uncharacterized protein n=1 Tax=Streptomyces bingchenggensis (strain BCW-1) TaxID=749414 RepID=D7BSU8_STRBB|nr:hypothetical protein SBI_00004 [Streptomyces bingchenggensis BCW-1]
MQSRGMPSTTCSLPAGSEGLLGRRMGPDGGRRGIAETIRPLRPLEDVQSI